MKKDVIYIDIEDDITSIIDKVKNAGADVVALVPPKRIGVLQSAVNLKLLTKAAKGANKHAVLITSDQSLSMLAAGAQIPVAKNLQSRPEIASTDTPPDDSEEEIIHGDELPVGDFAKTSAADPAASVFNAPQSMSDAAKEASDEITPPSAASAAAKAGADTAKKGSKNPFAKVPNFDSFRKRLFLFGGIGLALIIFLVWAIFFAPSAKITIAAKTDAVNINKDVTLDPNAETNPDSSLLKVQVQQIKKSASTEFDTTGTKDVGNKASGSMTLSNSLDSDAITVGAGTTFTSSSGLQFSSNSAVTIPGAKVSGGKIVPGTASVSVTARALGSEYNLSAQSYISSDDRVDASGSQMSGGSKETVNVVSQGDVDSAKEQLSQQNANDVKDELSKQFSGDVVIIQESFKADAGQPKSSPGVGEQAKRASLTVETTYTLLAADREDVKAVLNAEINKSIEGKKDRRIYSSGDTTLKFSQFQKNNATFAVTLNTTGYVGPVINDEEIAKQAAGKRSGEIREFVERIEGVENVDVKFSPFWVNGAPKAEKIEIRYTVKNNVD